jgi:Tol biopolymer transport system component
VAVVAIAAAIYAWARIRAERPTDRLSVAIPPGSEFSIATPSLAISPDGRRVAFAVKRGDMSELYSRSLEGFDLTLLARGDVASQQVWNPAFSKDGEWVAFARGFRILKVRATGGPEQFVGNNRSNPRGIAWGPDGSVYFSTFAGGLFRSAPDGSAPRQLTIPDERADENSHRYPQVLPDGKHILFTIRTGRITMFDEAKIALLSLDTGRWKVLIHGGTSGLYVPSGHIVFVQQRRLMAVPFDLETKTVRGEPVPVLSGIISNPTTGASQFAVAEKAGTLIYLSGEALTPTSRLQTVDRDGTVTGELKASEPIDTFRVSPDSTRIAAQISAANDDIWAWDVARDTFTRMSFLSGDEYTPSWSADGKSIFFGSFKGLYRQTLEQAGEPTVVMDRRVVGFTSPSPDGRLLAVTVAQEQVACDILLVDTSNPAKQTVFAGSKFNEYGPEFSPDGKWIAYGSDESGNKQDEVYLRPLSGPSQVQLSYGGATQHRWSRDGREVFFRRGDEFFSVAIGQEEPPVVGRPRLMFRLAGVRYFDVFKDGFLVLNTPRQPLYTSGINVVPDWSRQVAERVR